MASSTRGFLFADLRGYTHFADSRGDRAAAELLAAYREIVRGVIERFDGAEIRTEGDSFYVVFPAATAALDAGLEIVARASDASTSGHPIRVGVGVHAGETVETSEGFVGTAVNIAARVCAKADPGEVLVTGTVRSLTRTLVPYRFVALGAQHLKGVDEAVLLYRVETVASGRIARLRRQARSRRRGVLSGVGVIAVALAGGAAVYATQRPIDCLAPDPGRHDVVVRVDPARGCVTASLTTGRRPTSVVAGNGAIWVGSSTDRTLTIVKAGQVVRTTSAGGTPDALVATGDSIWVLHAYEGSISGLRYDDEALTSDEYALPVDAEAPPATVDIVRRGYRSVAFAADSLWFVNRASGQLLRMRNNGWSFTGVTAASRTIFPEVGRIDAGTGPVAADNGTVWIASYETADLWRLDPGAKVPVLARQADRGGTTAILAAFGAIWTAHADGTIVRTEQSGRSEVIPVRSGPVSLAASSDAVWASEGASGTVERIDASTHRVTATISVGDNAAGIAALDDSVWVALRGS